MTQVRIFAVAAILFIAQLVNAAPILTTTTPKVVTKQEAVMSLLKNGEVYKCTQQVLTKNMTMKAKGSDQE